MVFSAYIETDLLFMDEPPEFSQEEKSSHVASSVEDLSDLFLHEVKAFDLVQRSIREIEDVKEAVKLKKKLLTLLTHRPSVASNITRAEALVLVSHPIPSYHLLYRSAHLWPKYIQTIRKFFSSLPKRVSKHLTNIPKHLSKIQFGSEVDFTHGAVNGLFNLQNYYNLRSDDIAKGQILESDLQRARLEISSEECVTIAGQAGKMNQLHLAVEWLQTALRRSEGVSQDTILERRRLLRRAQGFLNIGMEDIRVMTRTKPYNEALSKSDDYLANKESLDQVMKVDWKDEDKVYQFAQRVLQRDYLSRRSMMYQLVVSLAQEPDRRLLCQGKTTETRMRRDTQNQCIKLHYNDPYLRLGPFNLEILNTEPFIGAFHSILSEKETDSIIEKSKGRLKPTPYHIDGELLKYSARRTSKLLYLSEKSDQLLAGVSRRVELATKFSLTRSRLDAENYQIMNYGVGGLIDAHMDTQGFQEDNTDVEAVRNGGLRTMTWMIYLTTVTEGGRTVFTGNNVAMSPVKGSVLFWLNHRSDGQADTRTYHTGCPVLVGNKWIANKWVKWHGSMWAFPCSRDRGRHYRHFNNEGHRF